MKAASRILIVLLVLAAPAAAQETRPAAPTETVVVTGIKDVKKAVTDFVGTLTVPTKMTGKLARWRARVCPIVAGLRKEAVVFVTKRVKEVAAQVGAPVDDNEKCRPNIEIVFTTTPQALLDTIFIKYPYLLGDHDNSAQALKLAAFTRPIQSWYTTATDDLRGNIQVDGVKTGGVTMDMPFVPGGGGGGIQTSATGMVSMNMPGASVTNVTGGRMSDGVSSDFHHIAVVAEPVKLLEFEIGTLADYIALLALSQTPLPDHCMELPTILNLLAQGCTAPPRALTGVDLAYLRALYKMTPTANMRGQRDEVIYQMDKSLVAAQ